MPTSDTTYAFPVADPANACGCCGGCNCACCSGTGYYTQFTFTISGLTDNPPAPGDPQCGPFNGTWTLTLATDEFAPECRWEEPLGLWTLVCNPALGPKWTLVQNVVTCSDAYQTTTLDVCDGDVLPNVSPDPSACLCLGYPASVTVTGVPGTFVSCGGPLPDGIAPPGGGGEVELFSAAVTPATRVRTPLPCAHLGDSLTGPERAAAALSHARDWRRCGLGLTLNPRGVPGVVCSCKGCGPQCPHYSPAAGGD